MGVLATFKITNDVKTTRLEFRTELKEEVRAICDKIKSLNERMVAIEADLSEFVLPKEVVDVFETPIFLNFEKLYIQPRIIKIQTWYGINRVFLQFLW